MGSKSSGDPVSLRTEEEEDGIGLEEDTGKDRGKDGRTEGRGGTHDGTRKE